MKLGLVYSAVKQWQKVSGEEEAAAVQFVRECGGQNKVLSFRQVSPSTLNLVFEAVHKRVGTRMEEEEEGVLVNSERERVRVRVRGNETIDGRERARERKSVCVCMHACKKERERKRERVCMTALCSASLGLKSHTVQRGGCACL